MRGDGQTAWWRETAGLAGGVAAGAAVLVILPILLSPFLGNTLILGLPVPLFLLALAVPLLALGGIFWFARRQHALDHRYDVAGD